MMNPLPTKSLFNVTGVAHRARRLLRWMRRTVKLFMGKSIRIHIQNDWRLGDEILAIPFYHLVRRKFPTADITVSVNYPALLSLNTDARIDNTKNEFDCDLYLFAKDDARSVPRLQHLCQRHRIPHEAIEPSTEVNAQAPFFHKTNRGPLIGYSCGAGWPCKSWSPARFRELAQHISGSNNDVGFVELGKDCPQAGIGQCLVDELTIEQTAIVLHACDLYIGPDSGLVHLALALGTPTVALYGPVDPKTAFGLRSRLLPVTSSASCAGCFTSGRMSTPGECPRGFRGPSADGYACMSSITPEQVSSVVDKALRV